MNKVLVFICATIAITIAPRTAQACMSGDPEGYFEGSATSREAGNLNLSLNLRCAGGMYEGELLTPLGTMQILGGTFGSGQLQLRFDPSGPGTISATVANGGTPTETLIGTFRDGPDGGPITLRRTGDSREGANSTAVLSLKPEQWRDDVRFLASELPKRHANAFHHLSRAQFDAAIADLDHRLDRLDGDSMYVALERIVNLIGDGHTNITLPGDSSRFPIEIRRFQNEYRVMSVSGDYGDALGARVLRIDGVSVDRVHDLLLPLTPQDETPILADSRIQPMLSRGLILHGAGVLADRTLAHYALSTDTGKEFTIAVHAVAPQAWASLNWMFPYQKPALYQTRPSEGFWYAYLPESGTVYCNFRSYMELSKNAQDLLAFVGLRKPAKLVIDLRLNSGGDYNDGLKNLVEPVRNLPEINKKGHLFVLVGPGTFSAAMSNAAQFRLRTAAILVGQAIGERPNSYQEARQFELPNSHLAVQYSTQLLNFVPSGENLIRPDKNIASRWSDFKDGRDTVMNWVVDYKQQ